MRLKRGVLLPTILVSLTVWVACGGDGGPDAPGPSVTATSGAESPTEAGTAPPRAFFEVWLVRHDELLRARGGAEPGEVLKAALDDLMRAGSEERRSEGTVGPWRTAIPKGTIVRDVTNTAGRTVVDLSAEFGVTGQGLDRILAFGQIVYTATQFEAVDGVLVTVEGTPVEAIDERGRTVDHALHRDDYDELLPPIVVEEPLPGAVQSPVRISGTADVFEATVSIRILGEDGSVLAETFATATCGSGCRGEFSTEVDFEVEPTRGGVEGVIEVFEESAETGEALNVVRIPVSLESEGDPPGG